MKIEPKENDSKPASSSGVKLLNKKIKTESKELNNNLIMENLLKNKTKNLDYNKNTELNFNQNKLPDINKNIKFVNHKNPTKEKIDKYENVELNKNKHDEIENVKQKNKKIKIEENRPDINEMDQSLGKIKDKTNENFNKKNNLDNTSDKIDKMEMENETNLNEISTMMKKILSDN